MGVGNGVREETGRGEQATYQTSYTKIGLWAGHEARKGSEAGVSSHPSIGGTGGSVLAVFGIITRKRPRTLQRVKRDKRVEYVDTDWLSQTRPLERRCLTLTDRPPEKTADLKRALTAGKVIA